MICLFQNMVQIIVLKILVLAIVVRQMSISIIKLLLCIIIKGQKLVLYKLTKEDWETTTSVDCKVTLLMFAFPVCMKLPKSGIVTHK